jgi:hypothetical protein
MTVSDLLQEIRKLEDEVRSDAEKVACRALTIASKYQLLGHKLQTEPYDRAELSAFILRHGGMAH